MKTLLLASVVLGLAATPALAQKDKSHGKHGASKHSVDHRSMGHSQSGKSKFSTRLDGNRNGILDRRERGYRDRDRDGRDDRFENRYGTNSCPPGLAKKDNGCMPLGQAKRLFREDSASPAAIIITPIILGSRRSIATSITSIPPVVTSTATTALMSSIRAPAWSSGSSGRSADCKVLQAA